MLTCSHPKVASRRSKITPRGPKIAPRGPKTPEDRPERAQELQKAAKDCPKNVPRGHKMPPGLNMVVRGVVWVVLDSSHKTIRQPNHGYFNKSLLCVPLVFLVIPFGFPIVFQFLSCTHLTMFLH